jgi:hypothetical protein
MKRIAILITMAILLSLAACEKNPIMDYPSDDGRDVPVADSIRKGPDWQDLPYYRYNHERRG